MSPPPSGEDRSPDASEAGAPKGASAKVRRPSITIDASAFEDSDATLADETGVGGSTMGGDRRQIREHLKRELADLHEHAAFDSIQAGTADPLLADEDPEAGYQNVRDIRSAKKAIASSGGQFVIGLIIGLFGLGMAVYAAAQASMDSTGSLIMLAAAAIIAPVSAWWAHRKYRQWLQHKTYLYRLLESLGEDVSELKPRK